MQIITDLLDVIAERQPEALGVQSEKLRYSICVLLRLDLLEHELQSTDKLVHHSIYMVWVLFLNLVSDRPIGSSIHTVQLDLVAVWLGISDILEHTAMFSLVWLLFALQ